MLNEGDIAQAYLHAFVGATESFGAQALGAKIVGVKAVGWSIVRAG